VQRLSRDQTDADVFVGNYTASYYIPGATNATLGAVELPAIGGSIYTLAGIPCPQGVTQPNWRFLTSGTDQIPDRTYPLTAKHDERNWDQIIERVMDKKDLDQQEERRTINLLVRRFTVLSNIAFWYNRWDRLELFSRYLVTLRGLPRDYWLFTLSLQRQAKQDDLKSSVDALNEHFPDIPVTILAKCMILIDEDPETVASFLKKIQLSDIRIPSALGVYGVLCIRVDLVEKGVEALEAAIRICVESPSERAVLASRYYDQEAYVKAMQALGSVGHVRGKMPWRLLRLQILVALELDDAAAQQAASITEQDPTNKDVQTIMAGKQEG
jgi:hypothetical protein